MSGSIVVIGASFGGFDALKVVLGALPASFPVPVAIVQHQANSGPGMANLLRRYTALMVADAEDKDVARAGWAYLAPPGYHLLTDDNGFALSVDPPVLRARPSIDVLFESAAEVYGSGSIGVILTGTGSDGAAGLAMIEARGGLVLVQDPATALRASMPSAALAATSVPLILPLERIGPHLAELLKAPAGARIATRDVPTARNTQPEQRTWR